MNGQCIRMDCRCDSAPVSMSARLDTGGGIADALCDQRRALSVRATQIPDVDDRAVVSDRHAESGPSDKRVRNIINQARRPRSASQRAALYRIALSPR